MCTHCLSVWLCILYIHENVHIGIDWNALICSSAYTWCKCTHWHCLGYTVHTCIHSNVCNGIAWSAFSVVHTHKVHECIQHSIGIVSLHCICAFVCAHICIMQITFRTLCIHTYMYTQGNVCIGIVWIALQLCITQGNAHIGIAWILMQLCILCTLSCLSFWTPNFPPKPLVASVCDACWDSRSISSQPYALWEHNRGGYIVTR